MSNVTKKPKDQDHDIQDQDFEKRVSRRRQVTRITTVREWALDT